MPLFSFGQKRASGKPPKSRTRETIETFVVALVLALTVRATVAEARFIPSESMLPTLEVGDRLIVEKVSYRFESPSRGDIVVFNPPASAGFRENNAFIKRVIGIPGDRLSVHDGKVFRNGVELQESYIKEAPDYLMPDPANPGAYFHDGREVTVPEGHVFVMGDNRNNSADSHVWGFLPIQNIIGRAAVRYWPPARFGLPG
ncbi:signal peptidase I [bacterium]|nr:signal peptidase I [bacterium]